MNATKYGREKIRVFSLSVTWQNAPNHTSNHLLTIQKHLPTSGSKRWWLIESWEREGDKRRKSLLKLLYFSSWSWSSKFLRAQTQLRRRLPFGKSLAWFHPLGGPSNLQPTSIFGHLGGAFSLVSNIPPRSQTKLSVIFYMIWSI